MRLMLQSLECIYLLVWFNIKTFNLEERCHVPLFALVRTLHIGDAWKLY